MEGCIGTIAEMCEIEVSLVTLLGREKFKQIMNTGEDKYHEFMCVHLGKTSREISLIFPSFNNSLFIHVWFEKISPLIPPSKRVAFNDFALQQLEVIKIVDGKFSAWT